MEKIIRHRLWIINQWLKQAHQLIAEIDKLHRRTPRMLAIDREEKVEHAINKVMRIVFCR